MLAVVACVALAGLAWLASAQSDADPSPPPRVYRSPVAGQPPTVLTYFYYWYDLPHGAHSEELTDHPPEQPVASYENIDWFRKELADMNAAGIDIALAVYWGDAEPSSDIGLSNIALAARQLRDEGRPVPQIGMFFDTGLIGRWPEEHRDLTKVENQERVYTLVNRFFSALPRDQWAQIGGAPLVWFWAAYFGITFDQSFFDYVYRQFEADFGVRPYIVGEVSWAYALKRGSFGGGTRPDTDEPIRIDDFYVWGNSLFGFQPSPGNIAAVGPGYDERELAGGDRTGRFAARDDGRYYERNLEAALAERKQFLVIETWNEFHEASDVAESQEYGRKYIEITRRSADRFHAQTLPQ